MIWGMIYGQNSTREGWTRKIIIKIMSTQKSFATKTISSMYTIHIPYQDCSKYIYIIYNLNYSMSILWRIMYIIYITTVNTPSHILYLVIFVRVKINSCIGYKMFRLNRPCERFTTTIFDRSEYNTNRSPSDTGFFPSRTVVQLIWNIISWWLNIIICSINTTENTRNYFSRELYR